MPKFKKKPVVVFADRWYPDHHVKGVSYREVTGLGPGDSKKTAYVRSSGGDMPVEEGDWIITDVSGDRFPCKDMIFQKLYEEVPDPYRGDLPETD